MNAIAPSAYRIEHAISAWQSTRSRLLTEDAELAHDEAALSALLGDEEGDVRDILERLLSAAQHTASMVESADRMIENLTARRNRYKHRGEAIRGTIFAILDAMGERKFEAAQGTVSISAGRATAVVTDESKIPDRFVKVSVSRAVDKASLLVALKDGEVIEGATLSNSMPTLIVRGR